MQTYNGAISTIPKHFPESVANNQTNCSGKLRNMSTNDREKFAPIRFQISSLVELPELESFFTLCLRRGSFSEASNLFCSPTDVSGSGCVKKKK